MSILSKRQQDILNLAKENGYVNVDSLAGMFHVTQQTIRRDLTILCDQNYLARIHGGASYLSSVRNFAYGSRQVLAFDEKQSIAKAVANIIPNNASVILNIGTTTEQVAQFLTTHHGLKIATNNINIVNTFSHSDDNEVWIAGGKIRTSDCGVVGQTTGDFFKQFKVDYAVIGISAIDKDGALLDFDSDEVLVSKVILNHCRKLILVADSTKFEREAPFLIGHLSSVDILVTSSNPTPEIKQICDQNHVELIIVETHKKT